MSEVREVQTDRLEPCSCAIGTEALEDPMFAEPSSYAKREATDGRFLVETLPDRTRT